MFAFGMTVCLKPEIEEEFLFSKIVILHFCCDVKLDVQLFCMCIPVVLKLMCNFYFLSIVFHGYLLFHLFVGKLFSLQNVALSLS